MTDRPQMTDLSASRGRLRGTSDMAHSANETSGGRHISNLQHQRLHRQRSVDSGANGSYPRDQLSLHPYQRYDPDPRARVLTSYHPPTSHQQQQVQLWPLSSREHRPSLPDQHSIESSHHGPVSTLLGQSSTSRSDLRRHSHDTFPLDTMMRSSVYHDPLQHYHRQASVPPLQLPGGNHQREYSTGHSTGRLESTRGEFPQDNTKDFRLGAQPLYECEISRRAERGRSDGQELVHLLHSPSTRIQEHGHHSPSPIPQHPVVLPSSRQRGRSYIGSAGASIWTPSAGRDPSPPSHATLGDHLEVNSGQPQRHHSHRPSNSFNDQSSSEFESDRYSQSLKKQRMQPFQEQQQHMPKDLSPSLQQHQRRSQQEPEQYPPSEGPHVYRDKLAAQSLPDTNVGLRKQQKTHTSANVDILRNEYVPSSPSVQPASPTFSTSSLRHICDYGGQGPRPPVPSHCSVTGNLNTEHLQIYNVLQATATDQLVLTPPSMTVPCDRRSFSAILDGGTEEPLRQHREWSSWSPDWVSGRPDDIIMRSTGPNDNADAIRGRPEYQHNAVYTKSDTGPGEHVPSQYGERKRLSLQEGERDDDLRRQTCNTTTPESVANSFGVATAATLSSSVMAVRRGSSNFDDFSILCVNNALGGVKKDRDGSGERLQSSASQQPQPVHHDGSEQHRRSGHELLTNLPPEDYRQELQPHSPIRQQQQQQQGCMPANVKSQWQVPHQPHLMDKKGMAIPSSVSGADMTEVVKGQMGPKMPPSVPVNPSERYLDQRPNALVPSTMQPLRNAVTAALSRSPRRHSSSFSSSSSSSAFSGRASPTTSASVFQDLNLSNASPFPPPWSSSAILTSHPVQSASRSEQEWTLGREGYYTKQDLEDLYRNWQRMQDSQWQVTKDRGGLQQQQHYHTQQQHLLLQQQRRPRQQRMGRNSWATFEDDEVAAMKAVKDVGKGKERCLVGEATEREREKARELSAIKSVDGSDSRRNQFELNQIMDVDEVKEQEGQSHTSDNSDDFEDINDKDPVEDSDDLDEGEEDVYERGEGGDGFGGTGGSSNSNRTDRSTRIERMNDPFQSDGSASQKGSSIITTRSSTSIVHSGTSGGARQVRLRESKNHECGACGKKFSRPSQLQTHLFMHSGEKPHQCSMCHKHFNVSSNLKRHIKTHFSTKRKSSRNGSMVFRSFSNGFTIKQSQESSRYDMAEFGAGGALRRHSTTVLQPSDRLRWMNTETLFSGTTAESHQKALLKEKAANEESVGVGPVSASFKSTQAPSTASTSRAASSTVPAMILEQTEAVAIAPSLAHTTATSSDVQVLPGKTSASSKITNVVKPKPA